jgi:hypothetical protein
MEVPTEIAEFGRNVRGDHKRTGTRREHVDHIEVDRLEAAGSFETTDQVAIQRAHQQEQSKIGIEQDPATGDVWNVASYATFRIRMDSTSPSAWTWSSL